MFNTRTPAPKIKRKKLGAGNPCKAYNILRNELHWKKVQLKEREREREYHVRNWKGGSSFEVIIILIVCCGTYQVNCCGCWSEQSLLLIQICHCDVSVVGVVLVELLLALSIGCVTCDMCVLFWRRLSQSVGNEMDCNFQSRRGRCVQRKRMMIKRFKDGKAQWAKGGEWIDGSVLGCEKSVSVLTLSLLFVGLGQKVIESSRRIRRWHKLGHVLTSK